MLRDDFEPVEGILFEFAEGLHRVYDDIINRRGRGGNRHFIIQKLMSIYHSVLLHPHHFLTQQVCILRREFLLLAEVVLEEEEVLGRKAEVGGDEEGREGGDLRGVETVRGEGLDVDGRLDDGGSVEGRGRREVVVLLSEEELALPGVSELCLLFCLGVVHGCGWRAAIAKQKAIYRS